MYSIYISMFGILLVNRDVLGGPDMCLVADALTRAGFPREGLEDWVCLVLHASYGVTNKLTLNMDGHWAYGLFAINDTYWCNNEDVHMAGCGVTCLAILRAPAAEQSWCAVRVQKEDGFEAWFEWKHYCRGGPLFLPNITSCIKPIDEAIVDRRR